MKNAVLFTVLASLMATSSLIATPEMFEGARPRDMCNDSLEITNILLAVADQIALLPNIKNFTVHKIEKGSMQDRYIYLLSGLTIGDDGATGGALRIIKTADHQWHETYYTYEVDYLNIQDADAQNFFQWRSMCNDTVGIANVMLNATDKIISVENFRDLQVTGGEKETSLDRETYNLVGMEVIGHNSVIGGFTLRITEITNHGPNEIHYTYDVEYQGIRNDENFPLRPPVLVRS